MNLLIRVLKLRFDMSVRERRVRNTSEPERRETRKRWSWKDKCKRCTENGRIKILEGGKQNI